MNTTNISNETDNFGQNDFDDEIELRRLIRSVSLAEKYFLFFAACNQLPKQKKLVKEIKTKLPDKKITVIEFKKPISNLLDELRKRLKTKKPDAVFVLGLRYSIPSAKKEKASQFIANLNISRDAFPKFLSCPLIIWLPEYAANKIMNDAPDFFSVRSSIFFFETDTKLLNEQISQSTSIGYSEIQALHFEKLQQRLSNLETLLAEYESLPKNRRDIETERQLKEKLADIYFVSADYDRAAKFRRELLETEKEKESADYTRQLNELARIYDLQGKYDEAIDLYKQALLIDEKTIGKEHTDYATRLNNLAAVYSLQSKYDDAIKLFKQALSIDEKAIGKEHNNYAIRLNNLAEVYGSQGKYDEAIELLQQALSIGEKTVGKEHPNYATRLNNLGQVYRLQGKYDDAIKLFKQALLIDEKTVGKEHPDYAVHLNNFALVYESQGTYTQALPMYEEAVRIFVKFLGQDHPSTQIVKRNLELCQSLAGKI